MFKYLSPLALFSSKERKRKQKFREKKKAFSRERDQFNAQRPQQEMADRQLMDQQINKDIGEAKQSRQQARQEGRAYARDVLSQDVEGLTPKQKSAMQYEANKQVQRNLQSANRRLLGDQGQRGIAPKSGVAYAQQRDLQRLGQEAQGQSTRDLHRLDADQSLKKLAAMFNIEQGEASQAQLDRQIAQDRQEVAEEKRRNRGYESKFNRLFSRV